MIVSDVCAYYASGRGPEVRAVDHVSLAVKDGEVLGIAGESGCGKSTLAAVMSLTARPPLYLKSGEIELNGQVIALNPQTVAPAGWHGALVALLPQRAMNSLNPTARVREFVVDVIRAHDPVIRPREAIEMARERLEQLSLPARVLDSYPHQLSGGMRQRVVAVVTTLLNPTLLIADEPTSALDVSSQKELMILLRQLIAHDFIRQIAFITHDLPLLSNLADRIVVMYAGKIAEVGTTAQVVDRPQHPYTQVLINSTLDPDIELRGQRLAGIRGAPPDLRDPPSGCRFHPRCPHAMPICSQQEPPPVGDAEHYATCWWVKEQTADHVYQEAAQ